VYVHDNYCNCRSADCSITWAGPGQLAITTGELSVRIWNLHSGDNFVLSGTTASGSATEFITSLAYSSNRAVLAAGKFYRKNVRRGNILA
jgi:hypothetical protein